MSEERDVNLGCVTIMIIAAIGTSIVLALKDIAHAIESVCK